MGIRLLLLVAIMALSPLNAKAQMSTAFNDWFDRFAAQALAEGISQNTLQRVASMLSYDESVIELDQKQPESKVSFETYVKNTLNANRIQKGRALMDQYRGILSQISLRYGVEPAIIVALWGIESSYGTNTGDYEVVNSLATLAFEGRRAAFFQKELIEALHIIEDEGLDPSELRGSWAGAMGQCQFMPSTYRRFAADFAGDGKRDIWNDEYDVLASIAQYLAAEGWQAGFTWGREVDVPRTIATSMLGLDYQQSLKEWSRMGLKTLSGRPLPQMAINASLIQPDGPHGRSFLVYDNFRALMRWNKSTYFATSVGLLANQMDPLK